MKISKEATAEEEN